MADPQDRQPLTGQDDHPQHRAPQGEGGRAPYVRDGNEHPEMSIFDGAGNESVVILATDEDGVVREGTGPDRESALKDAQKGPKGGLGKDFMPGKH